MYRYARSYCVISIDTVNSSQGGSRRHTELLDGLRTAVKTARLECPLGEHWVLRMDGDGMTIAVPPPVSKEEVLGEFPHRVDRGIRRFNAGRDEKELLRIRMAMTHGDVVVVEDDLQGGHALVDAARIRDIAPLREAMEVRPEAFVGLVLSDEVYRTAVLDGDPALIPHAYREVVAATKSYRAPAWIRLLGAELPRDGSAADLPSGGDDRPKGGDGAASVPAEPGGDTYNTRVDTVTGPFAIGRGATARQGNPNGR